MLTSAGHVGPYAVEGVLGRGRVGQVLLARDAAGAAVAVKLGPPAALAREFALLCALAHPHIVRAQAQGGDTQGAWLALEVCQGRARGPVPQDIARRWLAQAAAALAHVHAGGWVHRDVKPANLLVRADGSLALADFGSAAPRGGAGHAGAARLVGSPRHAAPEQLQGASAAPAADLYALGTVLHQWLTGRPAFAGETPQELLAQHLVAPVPRLPAPLAGWQPLLDALLAKDPARRPVAAALPDWKTP